MSSMRLACNILLGFLYVFGLWAVVSAWAMCVPLRKFWDPTAPGFCFDKNALWFSNSALHILTDFLILVWPMPVLKSLQLPKRQRFALMAIFALGILYVPDQSPRKNNCALRPILCPSTTCKAQMDSLTRLC